jgi:NADPH-dependent ferric siderophore reductase
MATGMAQRELESQLKALLKVVGDKDSAPAAIAILETLKKDVKPTEELLRVRPVIVKHIPQRHMLSLRVGRV